MQNRKILIIGGNGFIGQNLTRFLSENTNSKLSVLDRSLPVKQIDNVSYFQGDFFDDSTLENIVTGQDVVFHALSSVTPGNSNERYVQAYSMDLVQTIKLCDLLQKANSKLIFLSSGGTVYGEQSVQPIPEEARLDPINHYGALKVAIENHLRVQNKQCGTNFITARIANPYGPGQDYCKGVGFIDALLRCGIENNTLEIWGDGTNIRDYIHIQDVCKMLATLIDYEGIWDTFNLATGYGCSQNELVELARTHIPTLKVEYLRARSVDVGKVVLNPNRMLSVWGSTPRRLETGFIEYYEYLHAVL
jgi:UDP-glucose 4-epimerase